MASFCDDPHIDRLIGMILALGAEISVLSEQLDTLKRVMADHHLLDAQVLLDYQPPPDVQAERDRTRREFIAGLMSSLGGAESPPGVQD